MMCVRNVWGLNKLEYTLAVEAIWTPLYIIITCQFPKSTVRTNFRDSCSEISVPGRRACIWFAAVIGMLSRLTAAREVDRIRFSFALDYSISNPAGSMKSRGYCIYIYSSEMVMNITIYTYLEDLLRELEGLIPDSCARHFRISSTTTGSSSEASGSCNLDWRAAWLRAHNSGRVRYLSSSSSVSGSLYSKFGYPGCRTRNNIRRTRTARMRTTTRQKIVRKRRRIIGGKIQEVLARHLEFEYWRS